MAHLQKSESTEGVFPKDLESSENKNKMNEIKKLEEQINRNDLIYESSKQVYDFRRFRTRSFGDIIVSDKISIRETAENQSNLLYVIISNFNNRVRSRSKADKEKRRKKSEVLSGYYLKLLMLGTMKLLGRAKKW